VPIYWEVNWALEPSRPLGLSPLKTIKTLLANVVFLVSICVCVQGQSVTLFPLGSVTNSAVPPNSWHYYQVEVAAGVSGWQASLLSTNSTYPDLYVRRGQVPGAAGGQYEWRVQNDTNAVAAFAGNTLTAGSYFVGVYNPATTTNGYELRVESIQLVQLSWDPGTADTGTAVHTSTNAGHTYFRITTPPNSPLGAWRTALSVTTGEADLYANRGAAPMTGHTVTSSTRIGSDGFVLPLGTLYQPGQEWYFAVKATPGTTWSLWSGEPYVQDLGGVSHGSAGDSGNVRIGPEGIRFFKATVTDPEVLAWRLWLSGVQDKTIMVKRMTVPLSTTADMAQRGQMLVVPPYLARNQSYFIGVAGAPGDLVPLESRSHEIVEIPFSVTTNVAMTGAPYRTFKVMVQETNIAWQLTARHVSGAGDPNLAVRRGEVPSEYYNHAFSEVPGEVEESITLVPPPAGSTALKTPGLSAGYYYLTVYATNGHTFSLRSGSPELTPIAFDSVTVNQDTNRVGWRFFQLPIPLQRVAFGWELYLTNHVPGTQLAIRRVRVPGLWNYRDSHTSTAAKQDGAFDMPAITQSVDWLQRTLHEIDTWYVGVYHPTIPLGSFELVSRELPSTALAFDGVGQSFRVTESRPDWYTFFTVEVPEDTLGWDLRLVEVTGTPRLSIWRADPQNPNALPSPFPGTALTLASAGDNWPIGRRFDAAGDWTGRTKSNDGATDESGRVAMFALNRPLQPGRYFVGVRSPDTASYTLQSRGIGADWSIPIEELGYRDTKGSSGLLGAREAAYYRVNIPPNTPSWRVKLRTQAPGDAVLAVAKDVLPNIASADDKSVLPYTSPVTPGKLMRKPGTEHFLLLPTPFETELEPGDYYVAVVSEGEVNSESPTAIGTGGTAYDLESLGELAVTSLGTLYDNELLISNVELEGGDSVAFRFDKQATVDGLVSMGYDLMLENRTGNPFLAYGWSSELPNPGGRGSSGSPAAEPYGNDGGQIPGEVTPQVLRVAYQGGGTRSVMVKARKSGAAFPDATFDLRIRPLQATALAFNGAGSSLTRTQHERSEFFRIEVPANAAGWDIRLHQVEEGAPRLVLAKGFLPIDEVPPATDQVKPGESWWGPGPYWAAAGDWTGRRDSASGINESGRLLAMGMGRPLEPGTYYAAVHNMAGGTARYTLTSRGIGNGFAIPVRDLAFAGGKATNQVLPAREADYYRVSIPPDQTSWQVRLKATSPEVLLVALHGALPNVACTNESHKAGKLLQKAGNEHYVLLPNDKETALAPGDYYLAVVGEGSNPGSATRVGAGTSGYELESVGPVPVHAVSLVGDEVVLEDRLIEGGQVHGYRLEVPEGVSLLNLTIEAQSGIPVMVIRGGPEFPRPGAASTSAMSNQDPGKVLETKYGYEGGYPVQAPLAEASSQLITRPNPTNEYTLFVMARGANSGPAAVIEDAAYTLRIRMVSYRDLGFKNQELQVIDQPAQEWRFFRVEVPEEESMLGWDLRLVNVLQGRPWMVVCRDQLPINLTTTLSGPATATNWPAGRQWVADFDWSGREFAPDGSSEKGRVLAMGRGRPLEPGTYYIGVKGDPAYSGMLNYSIRSRGIGIGSTYPIQVRNLNFAGGNASALNLAAREADYYRVNITTNQPSWRLRLNAQPDLPGESLLILTTNALPNVKSGGGQNLLAGYRAKKTGDEQFIMLSANSTSSIPVGVYYLAVVGEGMNPSSASRIGTGSSSYTLHSDGTNPVVSLGTISAARTFSASLRGGESQFYQFTLGSQVAAIEVEVANVTGGRPSAVLRLDRSAPKPGSAFSSAGLTLDAYGYTGGADPTYATTNVLTIPGVAGATVSLALKARAVGSGVNANYPDADFDVIIRPVPLASLAFGPEQVVAGISDLVEGSLSNKGRAYYRVEVPRNSLGWELNLTELSGAAVLRVRKDELPSDKFTDAMPFTRYAAAIAPPFLTNGTYYVEVMATNSDAVYTLASSPVEPREIWTMPQWKEDDFMPGRPVRYFGGTDVDATTGQLAPSIGTEVGQGRYHFYAVDVPEGNHGLLRSELIALSGNPDLYVRAGDIPTYSHNLSGNKGVIHDRYLTNAVSEFGNWVPLNGKTEHQLQPGRWHFAVRAAGSENAKYHLRMSNGRIESLPLANGAATAADLVRGDWRYYRLQVPLDAPTDWTVTVTPSLGQVALFFRDGVPPGCGVSDATNAVVLRDARSDAKSGGVVYPQLWAGGTTGSTNFACPPLRPDSVYYLGVRALSDASFQLTSTALGPRVDPPPLAITLSEGTNTILVPPHTKVFYRLAIPGDAFGFNYRAFRTNSAVSLALENGTFPRFANQDHLNPSAANTGITSRRLDIWPWLPGSTFYLGATNASPVETTVRFTFWTESREEVDYDRDGMPDYWEWLHFGAYNQTATGDLDQDGVSNFDEFTDGTDPADPFSVIPRLVLHQLNGLVSPQPAGFLLTNSPVTYTYTLGDNLTLTAEPDDGYLFLGWNVATAIGSQWLEPSFNPLVLQMDTSYTVSAKFRVPGDDFENAIPLGDLADAVVISNAGATRESNEPFHAGMSGAGSVWFAWTAPRKGRLEVHSIADFSHALAVYSGDTLAGLVAEDNGIGEEVPLSLDVLQGVAYSIAIDSTSGLAGLVQLELSFAMDDFAELDPPLVASGNELRFGIECPPGASLEVWESEDLFTWSLVLELVGDDTGRAWFQTPITTGQGKRFYRVVVPAREE
jgi:large repetitive protein